MQTITGKLVQFLPRVEGDNSRGNHWVRGGFIIEYDDNGLSPRKAAFTLFGEEKITRVEGIAPNTPVQVNYQPESREFNGKWYTDLQCTGVTPIISQI